MNFFTACLICESLNYEATYKNKNKKTKNYQTRKREESQEKEKRNITSILI
jgi:hypothetical protein